MIDTVLARLIWKEYRVQRSFWISVAIVALLGQLLVWRLYPSNPYRPDWLFGMALTFPALFALGSAASLFAGEREDGTFEQLRILAVPAGRVLVSKLSFAALATVGMLGVLWVLAFQLSHGELPGDAVYHSLWAISGIACVEALAWGLFFSLIMRRALTAALLAAGAVCLSFPLIRLVVLIYEQPANAPPAGYMPETLTVPFLTARVALALCVLLVDVAIALNWVLERPQILRKVVGRPALRPRLASPFGRLLWQEARQAARTIAVLLVLAFVLLIVLGSVTVGPHGFDSGLALFVCILLAAVMGTCVFLAEQEGKQFRFFADHGIGPEKIWWSKHLVWCSALLVVYLLVVMFIAVYAQPNIDWSANFRHPLERTVLVLLLPVIGYCSGQLASILVSRGLVAGFFAILMTILIGLWMWLMTWLDVSLWWSAVPIPLIFLIASRVRVHDWLLERNTWRAWCRFTAVLGLPLLTLFAGIAAYRVFEIPGTTPRFTPQEILRPVSHEENLTADLYRQAIAELKPQQAIGLSPLGEPDPTLARDGWEKATPSERKWREENRQALVLTLQASQREACVLRDPAAMRFDDSLRTEQETRMLAWLLALDARRLESEGQLDEAFDRYVALMRMARHVADRGTILQWLIGVAIEGLVCERMPLWAAHAEQTPQRIRKALTELQRLGPRFPTASDTMKVEYLVLCRLLESDPAEIVPTFRSDGEAALVLWARLMPWEMTRSRRLVDALADHDLKSLTTEEGDLAAGRGVALPQEPYLGGQASTHYERLRKAILTSPIVQGVYPASQSLAEAPMRRQTQLNALEIILAIKGWQIEHDNLPGSLNNLLGEYFNRLPVDPFTGDQFGYRPEGFPNPVRFAMPSNFESEPGQPLIWSGGFEQARLIREDQGRRDLIAFPAVMAYRMVGQRRTTNAQAPAGWAFPIP